MNVIGTGLSGLVGSRVVELLARGFSFENLSLETGVDITNASAVAERLAKSDAPWVFHMAAYTNVQGAQSDHDTPWNVNVLATEHIADECRKSGKKLLYVDTDYAFDGKKKGYRYSEDDPASPLSWYAKTKTEGAKRVLALGEQGLVIRISNPYRAHPIGKKDWVHKMLERLSAGTPITCAKDQIFSPTFIDDIAEVIRVLIANDASGIYHAVSSPISPFDAGVAIADTFGYDRSLVQEIPFREMFANRAPVPQYAALDNGKITALGVRMHAFGEGIALVKEQEQ